MNTPKSNSSEVQVRLEIPNAERFLSKFLVVLSGLTTLTTLGLVFKYCQNGFDFTDEGFYLAWMSDPFKYGMSVTQFGFVYQPLYELFNGNITSIRRFNIFFTFSVALLLTLVLLNKTRSFTFDHATKLVVSAAIATSSLTFLSVWLPTPSYNWLNLQALLIASIGLLLADRDFTRSSVTGWLALGLGGWLTFMAKPTTTVMLVLIAGGYLALDNKFKPKGVAISIITAACLLVLTAFYIDGSITAFVERLAAGVEQAKLLGGRHQAFRFFGFEKIAVDADAKVMFLGVVVASFVAIHFSQAKNNFQFYISCAVSGLFSVLSLIIAEELVFGVLNKGAYWGLLIAGTLFSAILAVLLVRQHGGSGALPKLNLKLLLIFLLLPYAYVFGTTNNYWWQITHAGIFWVLAGLILLASIGKKQRSLSSLLPFALAVQFVTLLLIQSGIESPYHQSSLREARTQVEVGREGSTLLLSNDFAGYLNTARHVQREAAFKDGTPVLDLTGKSPGVLYAIRASNLGQPWIIGGYKGSESNARYILNSVSCEELANAWLLTLPISNVKIPSEILLVYGAKVSDYKQVGSFDAFARRGTALLKPMRTRVAAMADCELARKKMP